MGVTRFLILGNWIFRDLGASDLARHCEGPKP